MRSDRGPGPGGAREREYRRRQVSAHGGDGDAPAKRGGKDGYRRRKVIVEAPNGWIKAVLGFRQFSLRGIEKARAEWKLVCMALSLRRMAYL